MKTVSDLKNAYEINMDKQVRLLNPDVDDFTVKWHGTDYTIHAQEIESFPYYLAQHIRKHLAGHLLGKEGKKVITDEDWQRVYAKIDVNI
jgi:hypothetical protein